MGEDRCCWRSGSSGHALGRGACLEAGVGSSRQADAMSHWRGRIADCGLRPAPGLRAGAQPCARAAKPGPSSNSQLASPTTRRLPPKGCARRLPSFLCPERVAAGALLPIRPPFIWRSGPGLRSSGADRRHRRRGRTNNALAHGAGDKDKSMHRASMTAREL